MIFSAILPRQPLPARASEREGEAQARFHRAQRNARAFGDLRMREALVEGELYEALLLVREFGDKPAHDVIALLAIEGLVDLPSEAISRIAGDCGST